MTRNCSGSGATIWVGPDEAALCPQCGTPVAVYRHSRGGGYRVITEHEPVVTAPESVGSTPTATRELPRGHPSGGPVFAGGQDHGPSHLHIRRADGSVEPVVPRREPTWGYDDEPDW